MYRVSAPLALEGSESDFQPNRKEAFLHVSTHAHSAEHHITRQCAMNLTLRKKCCHTALVAVKCGVCGFTKAFHHRFLIEFIAFVLARSCVASISISFSMLDYQILIVTLFHSPVISGDKMILILICILDLDVQYQQSEINFRLNGYR